MSDASDDNAIGWEKHQKLSLANQCRLMADNQQVLNMNRQRMADFARHEAMQLLGNGNGSSKGQAVNGHDAGEPVNINIDSPTNHNYPQPPTAPQQGMPFWKKAAIGAGLTAVLGTGVGGAALGTAGLAYGIYQALKEPETIEIEKPIPGENTLIEVVPGETIVE